MTTSSANLTNDGLSSSPILTEEERRPVHAFVCEWATPEVYYGRTMYHSSEQWKNKYLQASHSQSVADMRGDTEAMIQWEMRKNFCSDKWWDAEQREKREYQRRLNKEAAGTKARDDLGPREFTLTYSPSWYPDDESAQNAMRCAIDRLTRYYKHEIKEFHAVGEFTTAGCSHVHGYYLLEGGRKITDKNFKRAYPHWNPKKKLGKGHEGGHHATVKRISDFAGYIEKHLEEAWMNIHINNGSHEVPQAHDPTPSS